MTGYRARTLLLSALIGSLAVVGPATAQAPVLPPSPSKPAAPAITVAPLGQLEGPAAGTLDASNGGLGSVLWAATPKAEAEALLDRLPISSTVTPIRSLARRLLLTKAPAPVGEAAHAFLTVRLRRLMDGGLLSDAGQLAAQGEVPNDPDYDRTRAEALLYAGDAGAVCGPDTARRNDSADAFWIRLRAYCYAASGDEAAAQLTRSVLQAKNLDDPAFDQLLNNLRAKAPKAPDAAETPDALSAYLSRQEGLAVTLDSGVELGTPGLLLAVRSKSNAPLARLQAAERVLRTGALPVEELGAIADAQSFSRDQFATEHAQVQQMPFLEGQALLRQAVRHAAPETQTALIFEALATAETKDLTGVAAALQHDGLTKLAPTPADRELTGLFARALMLSGESERAAAWIGTFNPALPSDAPLRARLMFTLHLMATNPARDADVGSVESELGRELAQKTADQDYAALALGLAAALKEPLAAEAEAEAGAAMKVSWPGRRPPPALTHKLAEALHAPGGRGAAIALILIGFGPQGPSNMAPDAIVRLVRDLERLGLPQTAREMAISAMLRFQPTLPPAPMPGSATL